MEVKLVRISESVHRMLAIQAATEGITISSFTEKAVQRELERIKKADKKQKPVRKGKKQVAVVSGD